MTEFWLIRHGETEWSRAGRHTSITDLDMTPLGREQASAWRGRLDPADFSLVLCSPLLRARHTCELAGMAGPEGLAGPHGAIEPDLIEWRYGDYEGRTKAEIHESVPGWSTWTGAAPPGGESAAQVSERLSRVVQTVRSSGVDRALAFGHGHALRTLALIWLGWDLAYGEQLPLGEARLCVLGENKGYPAVLRWNCPPETVPH